MDLGGYIPNDPHSWTNISETTSWMGSFDATNTKNSFAPCQLNNYEADDLETIKLKPSPTFPDLPKNVCPPMCVVCGDAASGYHYDVPSCNGCKTFFRRTMISQRKFRCRNGGKCFKIFPKGGQYGTFAHGTYEIQACRQWVLIGVEKRCTCRSCRFEKCVAVGMNPLAIQANLAMQDNQMFHTIVAKNYSLVPSCSTTTNITIGPQLQFLEESMERLIEDLMYLELKNDTMRVSTYNPEPFDMKLVDILETQSSLALVEKFEPMSFSPPPSNGTPQSENRCGIGGARKHWLFIDLLLAIDYAKTFPFFSKLGSSDKLYLMRQVSLMCCQLTQSFFSYEHNSDTNIHPDGSKPPLFPKDSFVMYQKKFGEIVKPLFRLGLDRQEYVLLKAIVLCNSAIPDLSEVGSKIVEFERDKYAKVLFNYIMAQRGMIEGPSRFQQILAIVNVVIDTCRAHKEFFVYLNVLNIVPIHQRRRRIELIDEVLSN